MILAVIVLILFLLRKPINKALTRGYRNKNAGNIRKTFDVNGKQTFWKGEIEGSDKDFKTFATMADGYRAIFALLREYKSKGFDTIHKIISRYAPSNENDTLAYINNVSKNTGIEPDEPVNLLDENEFKNLVAAISKQENGLEPDMTDIDKGYEKIML